MAQDIRTGDEKPVEFYTDFPEDEITLQAFEELAKTRLKGALPCRVACILDTLSTALQAVERQGLLSNDDSALTAAVVGGY